MCVLHRDDSREVAKLLRFLVATIYIWMLFIHYLYTHSLSPAIPFHLCVYRCYHQSGCYSNSANTIIFIGVVYFVVGNVVFIDSIITIQWSIRNGG